jgi:hypothetical protein
MRRTTHPSLERVCVHCISPIPQWKRADAAYCSTQCVDAAEKARYKATHPEYVKRQLRLVSEIRHMKEHGHTKFLDNPIGNPKDKYRVARSLGYRSMLEVNVARQLEAAGIPVVYEKLKIEYLWHPLLAERLER